MNAIKKLQTERQRLVARLAEIDKILCQYEELQRIAETYLAADDTHTSLADSGANLVEMTKPQEAHHSDRTGNVVHETRRKTSMDEFERVVVDVLTEAESPLNRAALYKALVDRGVVIGSSNENADLNTLSARMSRMKEKVVNVSGYGYWLKDRPFLRGGYKPEGANDTPPLDISGDENLNW